MKYLLYGGHQIYSPISVEEDRLVRDRLREKLLMECSDLCLWDHVSGRDYGSWYTSSCIFPIDRSLRLLRGHFDYSEGDGSFREEIGEPYVFSLQIGLPTDYENERLVSRWRPESSGRADRELFSKLCVKLLDRSGMLDGTLLVPTLASLYRVGFEKCSRRGGE